MINRITESVTLRKIRCKVDPVIFSTKRFPVFAFLRSRKSRGERRHSVSFVETGFYVSKLSMFVGAAGRTSTNVDTITKKSWRSAEIPCHLWKRDSCVKLSMFVGAAGRTSTNVEFPSSSCGMHARIVKM
jgi:hypothetical protein